MQLLFAQSAQQSGILEFLSSLDEDVLAPVLILGIIFFFVTCIVTVVTTASAYQKVKVTRMTNEMVTDLVNKGYPLSEVTELVHGRTTWDRVTKAFRRKSNDAYYQTYPVPPVKQPV